MIVIERVSRTYGRGSGATRALDGVSLSIPAGAFVTVVGSSGSGKTTLLNIIGGLDSDYQGSLRVAGRELRTLDDRQLSDYRRREVGFVFQHFNLLDHLDARQNVAISAMFGDQDLPAARRRAEQVLERVGLAGMLGRFPGELSGGQKQRVAIARALFARPRLILADEPTGNLDSTTGAQIVELFESLNRQDGLTVVAVTHEEFLFHHTTLSVHLEDGRLAGEQTP